MNRQSDKLSVEQRLFVDGRGGGGGGGGGECTRYSVSSIIPEDRCDNDFTR